MGRSSPSTATGARTLAEVTPALRAKLSRGEIASRTLVELLAVDFDRLFAAVVPKAPKSALEALAAAGERVVKKKGQPATPRMGIVGRMELAGVLLARHAGARLEALSGHPSDTVRGWCAYALTRRDSKPLALQAQLKAIRPFADDSHSGVREWAWMAARPAIAAELGQAIERLEPWTTDPSPNIRRFATEATRPRGVWCAHIEELKAKPALGLSLLEPLRADPTKYVQDSVSNWLNDAAKHDEKWVRSLTKRWLEKDPGGATRRICTRALRSVGA
ncbi:MAG: DNA alkylation repair protein [Phycisphaerales bacterium]|nr:DNA alkylation repair protein [Phycisphaerales bacterium]